MTVMITNGRKRSHDDFDVVKLNYGDGGDVEGYAKKVLWRCGEGCIIKNLARIGPDIVCYTCNLIANVADGDEYDML